MNADVPGSSPAASSAWSLDSPRLSLGLIQLLLVTPLHARSSPQRGWCYFLSFVYWQIPFLHLNNYTVTLQDPSIHAGCAPRKGEKLIKVSMSEWADGSGGGQNREWGAAQGFPPATSCCEMCVGVYEFLALP